MFYPNLGFTTDYESRAGLFVVPVRTSSVHAQTASLTTVIHVGAGAYITIKQYSWYAVGDLATGQWSVDVTSTGILPAVTYSTSGSGFLSTYDTLLAIDDVDFDAICDDTWGWSAGEIRLSINGTLKKTWAAGSSCSGASYDPRENYFSYDGYFYFGVPGTPSLRLGGDVPANQPSNHWEISGSPEPVRVGWRYNPNGTGWVESGAATDQTFAPSPADPCDCDAGPGTIEFDSITPTCWKIILHPEFHDIIVLTDDGTYTCYCNPADHSIGTAATWNLKFVDEDYLSIRHNVKAWPTDAGLLSTYRYAQSRCADPQNDPAWEALAYDTYGPTTVDEALTYMAYGKQTQSFVGRAFYETVLTVGACPIEGGGEV